MAVNIEMLDGNSKTMPMTDNADDRRVNLVKTGN